MGKLSGSGSKAHILDKGLDGLANTRDQLIEAALKYGYNETGFDRWRNNTELAVLASGTRTTNGNSSDQINYNARGVIIFINISAVSGTNPVLEIAIQYKDPVSGGYRDIASIDGLSATGNFVLVCYPGATESGTATIIGAPTEAVDLPLPRTWNIRYTIGGTNPSFTFSVGGMYVV